jgi:hypothetical protein
MCRVSSITAFIIAVVVCAAPAAASGPNVLYNFLSNQCLQPINGSTSQGATIVQEPCNGSPAQNWTQVSVGNNIFHFVNVLSGLCLDARGSARNRTQVQQWTCNSISNENWQPSDDDSNDDIPPMFSRVSGTSSYCLDIPGGQNTVGLAMQIYSCNGTAAQGWLIAPPLSDKIHQRERKK